MLLPPSLPPSLPLEINPAEVESALDTVNAAAIHMGYQAGKEDVGEEEAEMQEVFPEAVAESITSVLQKLDDGYEGREGRREGGKKWGEVYSAVPMETDRPSFPPSLPPSSGVINEVTDFCLSVAALEPPLSRSYMPPAFFTDILHPSRPPSLPPSGDGDEEEEEGEEEGEGREDEEGQFRRCIQRMEQVKKCAKEEREDGAAFRKAVESVEKR